jgi:hypothetical protein
MADSTPQKPTRDTILIDVQPSRGVFHATASYIVGKKAKARTRTEIATTRVRAMHRIISRMRRNGHGGKPYTATVDGQTLAGYIPHPNA